MGQTDRGAVGSVRAGNEYSIQLGKKEKGKRKHDGQDMIWRLQRRGMGLKLRPERAASAAQTFGERPLVATMGNRLC